MRKWKVTMRVGKEEVESLLRFDGVQDVADSMATVRLALIKAGLHTGVTFNIHEC